MARAVLDFFRDFGAGRFEQARARTASEFLWFGKLILREEWEGEKLAAYVKASRISASRAREVPAAILDTWLEDRTEELFDGALQEGDAIILVDIRRHGETSTSGVVVGLDGEGGAVVRRVFDPHQLSLALASIHA